MILPTMLLILSITGCKTTSKQEVYVPKLDVEVERPTLDPIPQLDLSGYTVEQQNALSTVLATYNLNLIKLIDYSERLLEMQDVIIEYYLGIMKVAD